MVASNRRSTSEVSVLREQLGLTYLHLLRSVQKRTFGPDERYRPLTIGRWVVPVAPASSN